MLSGTSPPDRVVQRASVRKWYVQTEHYCNIFDMTEGAAKTWLIQKELLKEVLRFGPSYSSKMGEGLEKYRI